jgi:hypothetical protein
MRFALITQVRFGTGQIFWCWFGHKRIGRRELVEGNWSKGIGRRELREYEVRSGLPGRESLLQKACCLQMKLS